MFASIGLPALSSAFPYLLLGIGASFALQHLSRLCSPHLFPRHYPAFSATTKLNWDTHVVAWVHSWYAVPAAIWLLNAKSTFASVHGDRVFGHSEEAAKLLAISTGYFLWDSVLSLQMASRGAGYGFVLHGIGCSVVFLSSFKPFLVYYGGVFLVWELSTIFLNPHWFLDKIGMTGSRIQLYNGIALLMTFFGSRLVFGTYASYFFFVDTMEHGVDVRAGKVLVRIFWILNLALNGLNLFWFGQMISSVRKRFGSPKKRPLLNGDYSNGPLRRKQG